MLGAYPKVHEVNNMADILETLDLHFVGTVGQFSLNNPKFRDITQEKIHLLELFML